MATASTKSPGGDAPQYTPRLIAYDDPAVPQASNHLRDEVSRHHTVHAGLYKEEHQGECLRIYLGSADECPWFVGLHVWSFADFRTAQGVRRPGGFNMKGVFTRGRQPKMAAHFLQERWRT